MNEMYLVGTLQDFGQPYSSLLLDKEEGGLYMMVRVSDVQHNLDNYFMASVSSEDVKEYMNQTKSLNAIFSHKPYTEVHFNGNQVILSPVSENENSLRLPKEDKFDPEFCYDKVKLKIFLKRYNDGSKNT